MPTLPLRQIIGAQEERCLYCSGPHISKKGTLRKKFETVQLWYCRDCKVVFTPRPLKGKTYPIPVIVDGLGFYHLGHSLEKSATLLTERYGVRVAPKTLSHWLADYKELCTYRRFRNRARSLFPPHRLLQSTRLYHRQVYQFRVHRAKLDLLTNGARPSTFKPLRTYLTEMGTKCPHQLFRDGGRASDLKAQFDIDGVAIREKHNLASRLSQFAVQAALQNKRRHDVVQKFMLAVDSVTVATEVPVYLGPEDIAHFTKRLGFLVPFDGSVPVSGHIDVLQLRNGSIHILDYKPNARREKPIAQLTFYALALSRRTGLRIYDFTCAWFDEHHYFEFYPLHVVLKKSR